uniref:Uncharacterized protein n=1 Tax=Sus scrofa TaxID=9823 RepID=A0A8D1YWN4_PIG
MNVRTPPRLLDLAESSLLRNEALAISALDSLPRELFPALFMKAFYRRRSQTLKAMVQAWPFVRLPLGGLKDVARVRVGRPIQAVLEGVDILLAQKVRPRGCNLQVLDLRSTGQNFWIMWSGSSDDVYSRSQMAPVAEVRSRTKQPVAPLDVFIDLCLKKRTLDHFTTYLLSWVERRKISIHLCCKKLKISAMPMENIMKVLAQVQLDCIQEVQVNCTWQLSTLAAFAPLLGQMINVQRLYLSHIHRSALEEKEQQHVVQFTSQFLRLHHLRDLYMDSPVFLKGHLDQMLRSLRNPLDNLIITNCQLTESDLTHLSQWPHISRLKGLDLSGITLTQFTPDLQVLLEEVASNLEELNLEQCGIMDSQLEAILPALSRCSQLRTISLCGNLLSMAIMEKLLGHTARLSSLKEEFYPAPRESFSSRGALHLGRLAQLKAQLIEMMRGFGGPRTIWLSSSPCPRWGNKTFYHEEPFLYHCYTPA